MKILITILLCIYSLAGAAQPYHSTRAYLRDPSVSAAAKDVYQGKVIPSDNDAVAGAIFDSLNTSNDKTRPFYLMLVTRMHRHADGAFAELFDDVGIDVFEHHTAGLMAFLYSGKFRCRSGYRSEWASLILDGIDISWGEEDLNKGLAKLKQEVFAKTPTHPRRLNRFFKVLYREAKRRQ